MGVIFVGKDKKRTQLLSDQTNYLLPFSGDILINDISAQLIFVNGDAYPVENRSRIIAV